MRLATIKLGGSETAGIVTKDGILPIRTLNAAKDMEWPTQLFDLIESGDLADLTEWYNAGGKAVVESLDEAIPYEQVIYAPLYRNPRRIFGIGLNYVDHAGDIGDAAPQGFPGSGEWLPGSCSWPSASCLAGDTRCLSCSALLLSLHLIDNIPSWRQRACSSSASRWSSAQRHRGRG
jgi:hypothetical protein